MIKPKLVYFEEGKPKYAWGDPEPTDANKQFLFTADFITEFPDDEEINNVRELLHASLKTGKKLSQAQFTLVNYALELLACMSYDNKCDFHLCKVSGETIPKRRLRG